MVPVRERKGVELRIQSYGHGLPLQLIEGCGDERFPDATKIAFVESRHPDGIHGWRIQIKDLSTLTLDATLAFDGEGEFGEFWEIHDLDWSRDGDCLAFSAASAGNKRRSSRHVYTLRLSQAEPNSCEPSLTQIIEGSGAAWSPDDGSLVVKSGGGTTWVHR